MLLRLGAATGARLRSLPHCCSDADLHQLVMWSKIVFWSSSDMDQAHCTFRKPIRQISYFFQVHVLVLAVAGKKMPTDVSQGFIS